MEERDRYSIGETAVITGISTKTLRYYDSLKLVIPEIRDPQNNYRQYSKNQVITLLAVQRLRMMGCGQKMLRAVLRENSLEVLCDQIELRIEELEQEIAQRRTIIDNNREFLKHLKASLQIQTQSVGADNGLLKNMRIEEIPKIYLFSEQRLIPHYNVCDTSVNFRVELYSKCRAKGLTMLGPEITTYYTNLLGQFIMHDCTIRIGIQVENDSACKAIQEFGGFLAATAMHIGSYDTMINTHLALLRWIDQNGYEVNGDVSEEFLVSPIDILDQKNQVIRVIMPVQKR